jgi:hypothetical protein
MHDMVHFVLVSETIQEHDGEVYKSTKQAA